MLLTIHAHMIKLIILGLLGWMAFQQPSDPGMQTDPEARRILDNSSEAFRQLESLRASLTITIELPEQPPYEQQSTVFLKDQQFKLIMEDEEIICDNKSIWRYLRDMNEVQVNDYEPTDDEITPTNIFTIYENDFHYLYAGKVSEGDRSFEEIELAPMDKDKSYFKVKIWVSGEDHLVYKMKVFDKNGSRYTYAIKELEKNAGLQDSFFQFDKKRYPGVHMEDLRF